MPVRAIQLSGMFSPFFGLVTPATTLRELKASEAQTGGPVTLVLHQS